MAEPPPKGLQVELLNLRPAYRSWILSVCDRAGELEDENQRLRDELASVRKTWQEEVAIRDEMIRQAVGTTE